LFLFCFSIFQRTTGKKKTKAAEKRRSPKKDPRQSAGLFRFSISAD
jgi:hypothetical protein